MLSRLFSSVKAASDADWEMLYTQELPRVYNFFRYRVGDGPTAEDLTSATFEKAWQARGRYRRDLAAFSTWLFAIARNTATDYFRRRRLEVSLDDLRNLPVGDSPEDIASRGDELSRLTVLLAELPERDRELLALKYGAAMTNRDIARLTGLSESNVGTSLYRIVHALRARWDTA